VSSSKPRRIDRGISWAVVFFAACFSYILPYAWISYSDKVTQAGPFLNLHPLLLVIYVPLAFGIFWPVLLSGTAGLMRLDGQPREWPAKRALIVFLLSAVCSSYFVVGEHRHFSERLSAIRAEDARLREFRAGQAGETQKALAVLQANGVATLSEPLTGPQFDAVKQYLDKHSSDPAELITASRHYRTSAGVMQHLAGMRSCPPEALEVLFENAVRLQEHPELRQRFDASTVYEVLYYIAWNPNTPIPVLVEMLDNEDSGARRAAAANPRLPQEAKLAYVKRAAVSASFQEREESAANPECPPEELIALLKSDVPRVRREAASNPRLPKAAKVAYLQKAAASKDWVERVWTAKDPDCPPEVLQQLAADPVTSWYAISNPSMPVELLQALSQSPNPQIRGWATDSLAKREKQ